MGTLGAVAAIEVLVILAAAVGYVVANGPGPGCRGRWRRHSWAYGLQGNARHCRVCDRRQRVVGWFQPDSDLGLIPQWEDY